MSEPSAPGRWRRGGRVLVLYHRPTRGQFVDAANVWENIASFARHSSFPVWGLNTDLPLPPRLDRARFEAILFHYSVIIPGPDGYWLPSGLLEYIEGSGAYKLVSFQDEYHHCQMRFDFINRYGIDCVYTLLQPPHDAAVYLENSSATRVVSNLPAYVGRELLDTAGAHARLESERELDIGYRGRPMPAYMGRGAQEKREIGERFEQLAGESGLSLDIGSGEEQRLYGEEWYRFIAGSRGTLGVESGVSCFDLRDEVRLEYEQLVEQTGREPTLAEMERGALGRWDWKIPYRTVSPRNFEAAAFRNCQILFEGGYSGVMEPMRHYIPLRKDFSNLDEVIERFRDADLRHELTANAYVDLIASGEFGYERLVGGFDRVLVEAGLRPSRSPLRRAAANWGLRPTEETASVRAKSRWEELHSSRPAVWRALWFLTRPVAVPFRLLQRALRS